ncbi:MAG: recombination protein RecR [Candidatus Colwellbacteria bacterium]|nr:recombination protein RecR [Candidatus Colwellbacteria bacterium]
MKVPERIKVFVEVFTGLPGIGPRQAIRLAFHFMRRGEAFIGTGIRALELLRSLKPCAACFYAHDGAAELCELCADPSRDRSQIAIVEKETDLLSMEEAGKFRGRYFILGDLRKNGVLEAHQKLRLQSLKERILRELGGSASEIIVALNPTTYGDLNADIVAKELASFAKKISRLGRGIPTGGEIEFADPETLGEAIEKRG